MSKNDYKPYVWEVIYDDKVIKKFERFTEMYNWYKKSKELLPKDTLHLLTWRLKEL